MPGTERSGRIGGNPELRRGGAYEEYLYKQKGDEPLEKVITVRLTKRLWERIRGENPSPYWQDKLREKLSEAYRLE